MSASNPPDAVVDQPGRFVGHADGDPIVHEGVSLANRYSLRYEAMVQMLRLSNSIRQVVR